MGTAEGGKREGPGCKRKRKGEGTGKRERKREGTGGEGVEDVVGDEVGGEEAGGKLSMLCHSTQRTEMQVSQFDHAEQLHACTFRCGFESGLGQLSLSAHTRIRHYNGDMHVHVHVYIIFVKDGP